MVAVVMIMAVVIEVDVVLIILKSSLVRHKSGPPG